MQNIFFIGPMGSGKTTLGKLLALKTGAQFYDLDQMIVERCGVDITTIFALEGEAGFRAREERVLNELTARTNIVLSTGGGAILSHTNRHLLSARGLVIYLHIDPVEQYRRTKDEHHRPLLHTENPQQKLAELFVQRHPLYHSIADYICYPQGKKPRKIIEALILLLNNLHTPIPCHRLPVWLEEKGTTSCKH